MEFCVRSRDWRGPRMDNLPQPRNQRWMEKIDSIRRAKTRPDVWLTVPVTKGQALFVTAADMHNEPASCMNCHMLNASAKTCQLIGEMVTIDKFRCATPGDRETEFWPCCGMHDYGTPNAGEATYVEYLSDPDNLGLVWINAPEVGLAHGGANCGGINGGDDCDHYMVKSDDKRNEPQGFCRQLQTTVNNGDLCGLWGDDDEIDWRSAQAYVAGVK